MTPDQLAASYSPEHGNHVTSDQLKAGLAKVRAENSWSRHAALDGGRGRADRSREPLKRAHPQGAIIATFAVDVRLPLPAVCPDCGADVLAGVDIEGPPPPSPFNALRIRRTER